MKSTKRSQHLVSLTILAFIAGMGVLVVKLRNESPKYMMYAETHELGNVYDRNGDVLFDGSGKGNYPDGYFVDVGNLIGDDSGQMTNTLVARNIDLLNNYSFSKGLVDEAEGKAAVYTTLDHDANRTVYDLYGGHNGCGVAYNYKTGEILLCTSIPNIDVTKGYDNIADLPSGTLISKAMYKTVPGSTQKVSTLISALEIMGADKLFSKTFDCWGSYTNKSGKNIDCHNIYGHGTQNVQQALENSCNPWFAQLVEDDDLPLSKVKKEYTKLGYALNGEEESFIDIDGIECETASTTLKDSTEFATQWGCIGQGDTLVSPVQLMMWQSAIANGTGQITMPYLIDKVTNVSGKVTYSAKTSYSKELFSDDTADTVRQMLLTNGANHYNSILGYTVGIKSGTAQVEDGDKENSLLVGFVDDRAFPVAFCVVLEDKNSAPITSEQIVKTMLDSLKNT